MSEFRFDHRKYKSKAIKLSMLDALMESIISAGTSQWASIVAGIKILIFGVYLWARKQLIDEEFKIAKQEYEQGRANDNADDILNDDMDGKKVQ